MENAILHFFFNFPSHQFYETGLPLIPSFLLKILITSEVVWKVSLLHINQMAPKNGIVSIRRLDPFKKLQGRSPWAENVCPTFKQIIFFPSN